MKVIRRNPRKQVNLKNRKNRKNLKNQKNQKRKNHQKLDQILRVETNLLPNQEGNQEQIQMRTQIKVQTLKNQVQTQIKKAKPLSQLDLTTSLKNQGSQRKQEPRKVRSR